MGTAAIDVIPQWHRFTHLNGSFAASWDWDRNVIMFVSRGGTITYDLAMLRDEYRRRQVTQRNE